MHRASFNIHRNSVLRQICDRAAKFGALVLALCLQTACVTGQPAINGSHEHLQAFLLDDTNRALEQANVGSDQASLATCTTSAILTGIPESDLSAMDDTVVRGHYTPEGKAAFGRWLGPAAMHGMLQKPVMGDPSTYAGGVPHYQDGTPQDVSAENAVASRIRTNAAKICPDLESKYSQLFTYW